MKTTTLELNEKHARARKDPKVRFFAKVRKTRSCWFWTGAKFDNGYGAFSIYGKQTGAHRASYMLFRGEIPPGKCVCHHCDRPPCVNPAHLFLGTHLENMMDAIRKGRSTGGRHKLTKRQQNRINYLGLRGWSSRWLSNEFGVSPQLIRLTWSRHRKLQALKSHSSKIAA